jgi:excisionase family DNA binding protein
VDAQHHDPLELHTLVEVARLAKRSRSSLYRDIAAGRLRTVKLGRQTRVPRVELERYLRGGDQALEARKEVPLRPPRAHLERRETVERHPARGMTAP